MYTLIASFMTLSIVLSYLNLRYFRMPMTIAVMFSALVLSICLILLEHTGIGRLEQQAIQLIGKIDFHDFLINGILGFLLFAGGLAIDLRDLRNKKWEIGILASVSTCLSTFIIGGILYVLLPKLGIEIPFIYALLFGALISPTDPIAVLALFKSLKLSNESRLLLEGESLFNDGIGIVIFLTVYQVAFHGVSPTIFAVSLLFIEQTVGGLLYGFLLGICIIRLMKPVKDFHMLVLLTLGVVTGGYVLGNAIGISGPLAMVMAGIVIGNASKRHGLYDELTQFWGIIDEVLNAFLFLLMGFELLMLKMGWLDLLVSIFVIAIVLTTRFSTVAIPLAFMKRKRTRYWPMVSVLTWGGLRGGLAVALALSLPEGPYRNLILTMTYNVVIFAVLVQGMTVKLLIRRM